MIKFRMFFVAVNQTPNSACGCCTLLCSSTNIFLCNVDVFESALLLCVSLGLPGWVLALLQVTRRPKALYGAAFMAYPRRRAPTGSPSVHITLGLPCSLMLSHRGHWRYHGDAAMSETCFSASLSQGHDVILA